MAFKNQEDHWAFLEEIEAPMWVDLTVEAKNYSQDIDDKWFHTSHVFHQCSSRQLKSAFSRLGEDGALQLDLVGSSSPKLPQSVSRSRGKDYKSKKWKGNYNDVSSNKIQPMKGINGKSSELDSGSCEGIKPKLSFISLKGTSSSKASMVFEITENVKGKNVKPVSTCGGPKRRSSPLADKSGDKNTQSTLTSEGIQQQQQQNFFEVSSKNFGQTSVLLSSVRSSLIRKSCITRPASRVEIKTDRRESRECNSSSSTSSKECKSYSSKSSVGSSSYTGCDVKRPTNASVKKELTSDHRNVAQMTEASKNKVKLSNMCNTSSVRGKEGNLISRKGGLATAGKPNCLEAPKSKANSQTLSKFSLWHKVNEQKPLTAAKVGEKVIVGRLNKVTGAGKENSGEMVSLTAGSMVVGGKGKGRMASQNGGRAGIVVGGKGKGQITSQNGGRTGMVVPKERVGNKREGKNVTSFTQKVYFR